MTRESSNINSFINDYLDENLPKKYTKRSPWYSKQNNEMIYLYRNYVFNERINEKMNLEYDIKEENNSEEVFNIYPEIPKKLSLYKTFKYRKAIKNFIMFHYSIKASTFIERKILKETKSEVAYIYDRQQYKYLIPSLFITPFCFNSQILFIPFCFTLLITYTQSYIGNFLFFLNYNDILMKYQINKHYKLGRETADFVEFLNRDCAEVNTSINKKFEKYFVKDIWDMDFKGEKLVDYLAKPISRNNYHQECLKRFQEEKMQKAKKEGIKQNL